MINEEVIIVKKAKDLKQGEEFKYSGREFIALGWEQHGILAVSKQTIGEIPFDKSNSNDWRKSSIRKYLNGDFLKKELDYSGLMKFTSDLMANDGMTNYGISVDFVFLLSADLYRKYRYQMPKWDAWVWLITPWSCLQDYGYSVSLIDTDGSLDYSCADDNIEAAVACLINPESSVICISSHSKEIETSSSNKSETNMTNEEALNAINDLICQFTGLEQMSTAEYFKTSLEGLKVAKDILEKQIPEKVKRNKIDNHSCCPKCRSIVIGFVEGSPDTYCWKCGQQLDWGNENGI